MNPGDVRFKVTLNSDQLYRVVEETESTHFYGSDIEMKQGRR